MNIGRITTADCVNQAPTIDPRCEDEAFRIQNPGVCPVHPILIIKPGIALTCALKSIQFQAFYTVDGIETDVTDDALWSSSDPNTALIGAASGNATGLAMGSISISAVYNDISASSELTVLGDDCCDGRTVGMMLLVDNSRSMSQLFGGPNATRLSFAKSAASQFIDEVNETKDTVGLMRFNDSENTVISSLSDDKDAVGSLVAGIPQTQQKTSFYDALLAAITELADADLKVIVLFSDGEDSVNLSYTESTNPIALLSDFRGQGGVVICMGTRASGKGFQFLSALATGGFFINAFPANVDTALNYLSGIKGYICAGNCTPEGDVIVGKAQLNYSNFINWDVVDGTVDLQGNGLFDFLPGNGLYVDLAGTNPNQKGKLLLKTPISLTQDHVYGLTAWLSGNQREDEIPESVRLRVFYLDDNNDETVLLSQKVTINDYRQIFQPYTFNFTAPFDGDAYISIQQEDSPADGNPQIGLMLNQVTFIDTTDLITLLDDDFDDENQTYVPPRCGVGTTYAYIPELGGYGYGTGYSCYGSGCLESPPVAQTPDPAPLPDIESGFQPSKVFSSTKTACAHCPTGFVNTASDEQTICKTSSATSSNSQSAADSAAYAAALAEAQSELVCERLYTSTQQYTASCPADEGTGPDITKSSTKTSLISQDDADALALADAKAQAEAELDCTQGSGDRTIIIYDPIDGGGPRRANPYPVVYVNLGSGIVSKVIVTLIDFTHENPEEVHVLLVGPTGVVCQLMAGAGDVPVTNVDITFDPDAGSTIPASGAIVTGDYLPSVYNSQDYPAPDPSGPYGTNLNVFNGLTAHGAWKLYIMDVAHLNEGVVDGGWSIEIQT